MYNYNARTTGHLMIYIKGIKDNEKKLWENDAYIFKCDIMFYSSQTNIDLCKKCVTG